jgi:hypothetical protein
MIAEMVAEQKVTELGVNKETTFLKNMLHATRVFWEIFEEARQHARDEYKRRGNSFDL